LGVSTIASPTKPVTASLLPLLMPLGIIGVVLMMVMPVPPFLLDMLLAISLTISVAVFLIALFVEKPLDFSAFPTVVLVATLLRLALNVTTTRLILLHGNEGSGSAGHVVETFGRFVVGGNVVIGLVVFIILVVINFMVITKGAGRIAEVAARFTLDAMPGKQMAIDAELSSGMITQDVARRRRKEVEREADFFGAMDGASKFVAGDAVAGIIITVVNLIGGLIRGVIAGMDVAQAGETFSILSVGDALVSQIPALLVSTAAGMFVTRTATGQEIGSALREQMFGTPRAVGLTAGVVAMFMLIPGMPVTPFLLISGSLGYYAYTHWNDVRHSADDTTGNGMGGTAAAAGGAPTATSGTATAEDIEKELPLDVLALEVGYELIPAVDAGMGGTLLDRIANLRKQFALDFGIILPPVRIRDNLMLASNVYRFMLLGTEVTRVELLPGRLLAMTNPANPPDMDIDGEETRDPVFNAPARWIRPNDRDLAEALGYTVVDHATVIATHMGETAKLLADQLLGRVELQHLFEVFSRTNPKLVDDIVPAMLPMGDVQKILRNLLREGISIRDLRTILEALAEVSPATKDPEQLTEMVRSRLARQITASAKGDDTVIHAIVLSAAVEDTFRRSLRDIASGTGGALDPEEVRRIGASFEACVQRVREQGKSPVLVTSPELRRYVRAFAERRSPQVSVISYREIDGQTQIRPIETVTNQAS
jgi:flagellar biosynthesis protein FlhA